uniref:mitochondrial thiamine pyrophosphate carrier-like isoform X2 n=1 Tax=Myxine glutinosa TaxID=7769 RepID=UPI00358F5920
MVGYKPGLVNLSPAEVALAGSVSGFVTRAVVSPLDLLKIRFQFVAFEVLTELAYKRLQYDTSSPGLHFTCGGMAACAATLTCQPLDMLRTRFASQGEPRVYHGLRHAVSKIYHHDGMLGFYRGLAPTLVAVFPYAGMQFSLYTFFTQLYKALRTSPHSNEGVMQSVLCGALAGMISKTLTYPFDLIKKRLQVQSFHEARSHFGQVKEYRGAIHCALCIAAEEGQSGLFKGLTPSLLKAAVATGLTFSTYELTCRFMRTIKGN